MTLRTNRSSSKEDHVNKFWARSTADDTSTTDDDSSGSNMQKSHTTMLSVEQEDDAYEITAASYNYTIQDPSTSATIDTDVRPVVAPDTNTAHHANSSDVSLFNQLPNSSTKRYQTKMLLASLIEHFCRAYGDTPDANRKVFFLICQTLRSLGIIDAEFVDEMTSVRSAFQQAFHKLFYTAVQTVRNQDLVRFDDNLPVMLIKSAPAHHDSSLSSSTSSSPEPSSSTLSSSSSSSSLPMRSKRSAARQQQQENDYFSHHSTPSAPAAVASPATIAYQQLSPTFNDTMLSHSVSKMSNSAATASSLHSFISNNTSNSGHGGGDFFGNLRVQNSRYNNDFVEISLLGKGGFACAFKARNKLDDIDYAVKKIRLGNDIEECDRNEENPYEKIFREIKNLARLEHQNVIRYYSSWLEYDDSTNNDSLATDGSDWEDDTSRPYLGRRSLSNESSNSIFRGRDPTFSDLSASSFGRYHDDDASGMSHIQFGEGSTSDFGGAESNSSWSNATRSQSSRQQQLSPKASSSKSTQKSGGWTLFIQMQLCPTTLHDYIRFRNKQYSEEADVDIVDTRRNIEIFAQILEGTAYIHDQGLIHRDLKPSNIFLSMPSTSAYFSDIDGKRRRRRASSAGGCLESSTTTANSSMHSIPNDCNINMWEECWVPKIGDFGLAAEAMDEATGDTVLVPTPMSSTPPSPKMGPCSDATTTSNSSLIDQRLKQRPKRPKPKRTRTIGVGTRTYASPEQLAIPAQAYDEKVDIYSLGIILFELFQPFTTGMERADSLDKLKRGIFPNGFLEMYPKVSALILWMMDHKPDHRPSAHQLLEFELFSHPNVQDDGDMYLTLQTQLQSKMNQLERKNKEIEELKQKVIQMEQEKQQAIQEMQQRLQEMQLKLNQYEATPTPDTPPTVKKCSILNASSSFLKKKKEVRWSMMDS
ncbi:EIF2 alpha kinase Hri1 [Mucor ambiguus]|uniref:non-specific serine/threonine protein kinase n=1 Tax=Mucor ambiguus TaxID=91626 RepID=A0A0C9N076_9FUNG|nr:EIF2 alpha kinase Hri1 [Mucor ambiguus]